MTGTAVVSHVANLPAALPDFLQSAEIAQQVEKFNAAAMGGIKSGGFPRISLSGSKFFILDSSSENPRQLITVLDPSGTVQVPSMVLSVIIVGANPALTKTYYEGPYVPGEDREPDCSSDDGIRPDPHILTPQHNACATCPKNAWGSRTNPQGKESKACSDNKRLVLIPEGDLNYKAMSLIVTPAMLKDWGAYVRMLSSKKVPVHAVVTRLTFDSTVDFPKLNFAFGRFLSKPEYDRVLERMESDEVKNIEKPVRTPAAALPAPTAAALPVIQAPAQPVVQPAPAPAPVATASFATAPAPVAAPEPAPIVVAPPPPPVVDPLAGLPPETIAAINAVGGIQTATGAIILQAARASVAAPAAGMATQAASNVVSMESGKRPRGRPAKTQPADPAPAQAATFPTPSPTAAPMTTAPVAGTPPANPVVSSPTPAEPAPTTGFATSPAAVVVPPGSTGLAGGLDEMLASIMGGNK